MTSQLNSFLIFFANGETDQREATSYEITDGGALILHTTGCPDLTWERGRWEDIDTCVAP